MTSADAGTDRLGTGPARVEADLAEETLWASEEQIGAMDLADLIDVEGVQSLVDDLYALTRIPSAIIDLEGKVLVGAGWQDICTRFHRQDAETLRHCVESDTQLSRGVPAGSSKLYKCKNNMWDVATPIVVGGHHVGNVFSGQFFFEGEAVDRQLFRAQAKTIRVRRTGVPRCT